MPYQDDARAVPARDVLSRVLDGEAVLLNLESGTYFGLNPVGSRVWELIGTGNSVGQIRAALLEEFEVSADVLARDLEELLRELEARGLVTFGGRD